MNGFAFGWWYHNCSMFVMFIGKQLLKAMLHEAMFLITPHFATAIDALRVARKVERPSTFRNVRRQAA